jgi:hypothetical protein
MYGGVIMRSVHKTLLFIDGLVNMLLGFLLLLFPAGVIRALGLPPTNTSFYPSLLGAVLFGIGLALFLELAGRGLRFRGLGLGGAIVINFLAVAVLFYWLLFGRLAIPAKGRIILWGVTIVVLVIGLVELARRSWAYEP